MAKSGEEQTDECSMLHVDMDAFFAAVEVLDDATLRGKPVVVGGTGARGVVASCTYEARAFGIRSAMPSAEAKRRCPQAVFLSGRYSRYSEMSDRFRAVLLSFTPLVEPVALDEAFLDVSGIIRSFGPPSEVAFAIRSRVESELHLRCSVGVGRSKLIAKLASRAAKPTAAVSGVIPGRGVVIVPRDAEDDFLEPLAARALWGVGPASAARLEGIGVNTVGDLRKVPLETLCRLMGPANGTHLAALARGEDERHVQPRREAKSVSHEETFATDLSTHSQLRPHLLRMADAVGARLSEAGLSGRTVVVKARYPDLSFVTRSHTVATRLDARSIAAVAEELLISIEVSRGVRLLGVSVSGLTSAGGSVQLSFDDVEPGAGPANWTAVEEALVTIRSRFGHGAVAPATLASPDGLRVKRRGDTQWGPSS